MRGDGVPQTDAHGGVRAGVEAQARIGDGEYGARNVHCVGSLGDVDDAGLVRGGEAVEGCFDGGEGGGECHRDGGGRGSGRGCGRVGGFGGREVRAVGGGGRLVGPGGAESAPELGDDGGEVADYAMGSVAAAAPADFFGGDVDLDEFHVRVPFGGVAEVEDPVEPRAEEEDHVGFFESAASGTGRVQRVGVRKHAFAHGGGEEGQVG